MKDARLTPELRRRAKQLVGAYGEKVVEAHLLRRGWLASNVNASIKNAADFDIFALKEKRTIQVRVKSCGPGIRAFQFGFRSAAAIAGEFGESDFTVLISMGRTLAEDECFVVPTAEVRAAIIAHKQFYLAQLRKDGAPRKDTGHWSLHLSGPAARPNQGWAEKWAKYRDGWEQLESHTST